MTELSLLTFDNLLRKDEIKKALKINKARFVFDETTLSRDFVDLSENINLEQIIFKNPQPNLKFLSLSNCSIKNIIFPENCCPNLEFLYIDKNGLEHISFKGDLPNLQVLILSRNNLNEIELPFEFKKMRYLSISENNIKDLGGIAKLIVRKNFDFSIAKNENIQNPPPEFVKEGKAKIIEFFEQALKYDTDILYEGKILILGEPQAGKSTLYLKLQNPELLLPDTESTLGIEIKEGLNMPHPTIENTELKANLWDFGGQEIQKHLHQYFVSSDALYVLVSDKRSEKTNWDYWFDIIKLLAKEAVVLLVFNNNGTASRSNFNIDKYDGLYPDIQKYVCELDFSINDSSWTYLQQKIREELAKLPLVNKDIPIPWLVLRSALEAERKNKNHIHLSRFYELCPSVLSETESHLALEYFNNLGIVHYFSEDNNLSDIIFLNPRWITNGLYAVLSKDNTGIHNGVFTKEWIFNFWAKHKNKYNAVDQSYLLRLMLKDNFGISYPLDNDKYVVPFMLPEKEPKEIKWSNTNNLGFRIQYPFMPMGIMSRLIVQLYSKIEEEKLVWRDGVILRDKKTNCRAKIIQSENKETGLKFIDIRLSGADENARRDLLSEIRNRIYHIHESFKNIPFTELVQCNCAVCSQESQENHYFKFNGDDGIQGFLKAGKKSIQCPKLKEDVPISNLIGPIYTQQEIDSMVKENGREPDIVIKNETKGIKLGSVLLALLVFVVTFGLIIATAVVFKMWDIEPWWMIAAILFELLLLPMIWTFIVSPGLISENNAIKNIDNVLKRMNILSMLSNFPFQQKDAEKEHGVSETKAVVSPDLLRLLNASVIYFETAKSVLSEDAKEDLNLLSDKLLSATSFEITINGYADKNGDSQDNIKLSYRRAKTVYDYLLSKGITKKALSYQGIGELENNTELQKNRCVKFDLS